MMEHKSIKLYVDDLDEKFRGIPEGHIVIIAGNSGSMKSTLAFNILYQHALEKKEKSVYITLEQPRGNLVFHLNNIGLSLEKVKDFVTIVDLGYIRQMLESETDEVNWKNVFETLIRNFAENEKCKIIVVDSLDAIYAMADLKNPRSFLFYFFQKMRDAGVTSLIITEMDPDSKKFGKYGVEDFLADGVLHISVERVGRAVGRYISIVKMRGVKHPTDYYPLVFENGKFKIVSK
jgi:circadian clock protein KaiC